MSIADDDIWLTEHNWSNELRDIFTRILIVAICIDYDICSLRESMIDAVTKSSTESSVATKRDYVMNAKFLRHLDGIICTSIINDLILDDIDAL